MNIWNYDYVSACGVRPINEDRVLIRDNMALVLDGHAYRPNTIHIVDLVVKYFPIFLEKCISQLSSESDIGSYISNIQNLFLDLDEFIYQKYQGTISGGTTLTGVVFIHDKQFIVNIGDSKTVLINGIMPIFATKSHKPKDRSEYARIIERKSFILNGRVDGGLNISRTLGDYEFKKVNQDGSFNRFSAIYAMPDVTYVKQSHTNIFIYSDGLGDYIDLLRLITIAFSVNKNEPVSVKLVCLALKESKDNISIIHLSP